MERNFIIFFAITGALLETACCFNTLNNITKYLTARSTLINDELNAAESAGFGDVEFGLIHESTKSIALPQTFAQPADTFTLFNKTFLLLGFQVYKILHNDGEFELKWQSEFSKFDERIAYFRSVGFDNNTGLIFLTSLNGYSYVFGFKNDTEEYFFVQSISHPGVATDAQFYTNQKELHLIIIANKENACSESIIYKWTGAYFDQVASKPTRGAIKVSTFSSGESEIIVILQKDSETASSLFDYQSGGGGLRLMQHLKTEEPTQVVTYRSDGEVFVAIFQSGANNTLYRWKDNELIAWNVFEGDAQSDALHLAYAYGFPFIFAAYNSTLVVSSPNSNTVKAISKTHFQQQFQNVQNLQYWHHEKKDFVFVVGAGIDGGVILSVTQFSLNANEIESRDKEKSKLLQCLFDLEQQLLYDDRRNKLTKNKLAKVLQANESAIYRGRMNVAAPVFTDTAIVSSKFVSNKRVKEMAEIKIKLNFLRSKVDKCRSNVDLLSADAVALKGKIAVKGVLRAKRLTAKSVRVDFLNGKKWNSADLLSYTEAQMIRQPAVFKILQVKELSVSQQDVFQDLFLRSGNQIINASHIFGEMAALKIYTPAINSIPFSDIYLSNWKLLITGKKYFSNISINELRAKTINNKSTADVVALFSNHKARNYTFQPELAVENFYFDNLNGVNWNTFKNSVFVIGSYRKIHGNLRISKFKSNQLQVKRMAQINTEYFLTTSTKQVVNSTINFKNIYAENMALNALNDIAIEDAASFGEIIKGPVRIDNVRVTDEFHIHGTEKSKKIDNHIVGTNETDLLQIYNKKVKIVGSLIIQNIYFVNATSVSINNYEFHQDILYNYWLRNKYQTIPTHFVAQKGATAPYLRTNLLNNVPVEDYLLIDNLVPRSATAFHFENITIAGDVFINKTFSHSPNLDEISYNAVRLIGKYAIKGEKHFLNSIKIGNLVTKLLDNKEVSKALTKKSEGKILGIKSFETLIIREDLSSASIKTHLLNDFDLTKLMSNTLFVDTPAVIAKGYFSHIKIENLQTEKLNSVDFLKHVDYLGSEIENLDVLNNVEINGNVEADSVQNLKTINGIATSALSKLMVNNKSDVVIDGDVTFKGNLFVNNFNALVVNGIDLKNLIGRVLYRDFVQNITAKHTFNAIKSPHLIAPLINNVRVEKLIDVTEKRPQTLTLRNGLRLASSEIRGALNAKHLECDLYEAALKLKNSPIKSLRQMQVTGSLSILDDRSTLAAIISHAVTKSAVNLITAPVTFKNHISGENIISLKFINDVNISHIYADALLKYATSPQIIAGVTTFDRMELEDATIPTNAQIPFINDQDVLYLNESIVYKENVNQITIKGHKTFFGGLQANALHAPNLATDALVSLANLKPIPQVTLRDVVVEGNFDVGYVNRINFSEFLENRLQLHSREQSCHGTYYFDHIILNNNSFARNINNVDLKNVVFDDGFQEIRGEKQFLGDVKIDKDAVIGELNGLNITKLYENAIFVDESVEIRGDLDFQSASKIHGNLNASTLNGVSISEIKNMVELEVPTIKAGVVKKLLGKISKTVKECLDIIKHMPNKYMYLEKANEMQISLPKTTNAQAVNVKGDVMIHIAGEEIGSYCGLPDFCTCPVQHTLHITPHFSMNEFINKGSQRVYSYDDEHMTAHFITNSVSVDNQCRANPEQLKTELSTLTWSTVSGANQSGEFYLHPEHLRGYVSGVEFFSSGGHAYAVVGVFYDPVADSHDLPCQVIRFSEDKRRAELIQTIPTKGLWTLEVFSSAQGAVLIAGNVLPSGSVVNIYRFDGSEFKLLRNVFSFACASAAGVVLGDESLIVLAEKEPTLQVYKYSTFYDNYYFYQSLQLDSKVSGVSAFYASDDIYLSVVAESGNFYVYSFHSIEGWKLQFDGEISGLRTLIPFTLKRQPYLFGASSALSTLLAFVKQGSN